MDDGSYDPCECVCAHEAAMRRLLSLLRQAQSTCTDNQCFGTDSIPGLQSETGDGGWGLWMFILLWLVIALLLFLFRPTSMRRTGKPIGDHDGGPGTAPPSPPIQ
ncbi:small integral membrane protein 14-like [Corticium candelabrum]|uniref:small integral membrane protein 14-like n=1 Tax=Corticium candelabrum TaxID=121492 RepID=UPI002E26773C|nr:small integral membrane protein 14-like [Corticium candelabrum]